MSSVEKKFCFIYELTLYLLICIPYFEFYATWKEELLALKIGKLEVGVVFFPVSLKTGIEEEFP